MGSPPKKYKLGPDQLVALVGPMGGCIASDEITVKGRPVGSMVREPTRYPNDSGWLFTAGDESQAYIDDASNLAVSEVNTIAPLDPEIIPYLYALPGQVFDREPATGMFVEALDSAPDPAASTLPPGVRVQQGRVAVEDGWSLALPVPFRRRLEEGAHVFWRPSLTAWVEVANAERRTLEEHRRALSPGAFDVRSEDKHGLASLVYRIEDEGTDAKVPALYAWVASGREQLGLGIFFDREEDLRAALALVASVGHGLS